MADTVNPIPLTDHMVPLNEIIVTASLIVAGRLDREILHDGFIKLVDQWPKLGARLVMGNKGLYEYHIPSVFSDGRPPFKFTVSQQLETQCPNIPKRTLGSHPEMLTFMHLFRSPDCAITTTEWVKRKDAPLISIHITTFSDATCIGFSLPHIFADVSGVAVILRAWCSLLAGRTSDIPTLITEDPLANLGAPYPSSKKELKTFHADMEGGYHLFNFWDTVRYYVPLVKEFLFHPKEECRMVFLPTKTVEKHRRVALAELQDEKEIWVSENDIVVALIIKLSNLYRSAEDKTPYVVAFNANFRGQIPVLQDPSTAYLHNLMTPFVCPPISNGSLQTVSVGYIARLIRGTIEAQRPIAQREKQLTVHREVCRRGVYPAYCAPNARSYSTTSWLAGRWTELDFSPALIAPNTNGRSETKAGAVGEVGKPIFAGGVASIPTLARRFWALVLSKQPGDVAGEGGFWIEMAARPERWPQIDEYLLSL